MGFFVNKYDIDILLAVLAKRASLVNFACGVRAW